MNHMDVLDHVYGEVQSGKISADTNGVWDEKGECLILAVNFAQRNGKNMIAFRCRHAKTGDEKELDVMLPDSATDQHRGLKIGRVFSTLFAMMGWTREQGYTPSQCLAYVQAHLQANIVKVRYTTKIEKKWNESKGEDKVRQYLETFERLGDVARTTPPPQYAAPQPAAQMAAQAPNPATSANFQGAPPAQPQYGAAPAPAQGGYFQGAPQAPQAPAQGFYQPPQGNNPF